jgi:8-oxo-dGTP pyrophosphatase MutT (NUDIX family)
MTVLTTTYNNGFNNGNFVNHYNDFRYSKAPVLCANCGGLGHIYKNCNHPVTSYGVICFRLKLDESSQCIYPEYLMVQRKDSLSYVEFVRGKYDIERRTYIMQLFANMTRIERDNIQTKSFETLWKTLWQVNDCNLFEREYNEAKTKFEMLKRGIILETEGGPIFFNLEYILNNTNSILDESEWGFPKGRRNINEPDFACALREFSEETGMKQKFLKMVKNQKPFEEVFSGSNRVRYKHVYYLAMCTSTNDTIVFNQTQKHQVVKEIKDVRWFRYTDAQMRIRDHNIERKELFKRINQIVLKNLCVQYNGR